MANSTMVYLAYLLLVISSAWSFWHFRQMKSEFKAIAVFIWVTACVQGISELLASQKTNNLFLSHIYTVLSFVILVRFYQYLLRPFFPKALFAGFTIGFVFLAILTVMLWQPITTFNSITLTVQSLVFIVFSMSTFILSLNEELNQHLRPFIRSLNWINSGVFLYFSGSLLIFYNGATIIHAIAGRWSVYTMLIHTMLAAVLYFCILIGLWRSPKI